MAATQVPPLQLEADPPPSRRRLVAPGRRDGAVRYPNRAGDPLPLSRYGYPHPLDTTAGDNHRRRLTPGITSRRAGCGGSRTSGSGSGSGKRTSRNAGHRAPTRLHNAIRDQLPDTVAVLDAFHVVRLGTQVVDEVRRRVQQDTLGHRGHKHDPLYQIRGLLRPGVEHLSERQQAKLTRCLEAGDPDSEVDVAWQCYQQLRSIYHASTAEGRRIAEKVIS